MAEDPKKKPVDPKVGAYDTPEKSGGDGGGTGLIITIVVVVLALLLILWLFTDVI